jgi:dihydrofolate synthase/folylpolyglutamate synthase
VNGSDQITFFEITTAAAFLAFSRVEADYTILEVGLGGRLDATNVIHDPRLCVITPVSMDHQQYLGETLQEIAFEKAGILKSGVPCVVGFQQDQAQTVIEHVDREKNAPLRCLGVDWSVWLENDTRLVFQNTQGLMDLPKPVLLGSHQVENAGIAVAALTELGFAEDVCQKALLNASWPARLQRLKPESFPELPEGSEIWLDGGHNAAAGQTLGVFFADLSEKRSTPLYLICGMLKTKDAENFLSPFKGLARHVFGVTREGEENSFSGQDIQAYALKAGMSASSVNTLQDAITGITHSHYGETPPRILICGSLYFAGQVLRSL